MTELRRRMDEAMIVRGMADRTREALRCPCLLVCHCPRPLNSGVDMTSIVKYAQMLG